MGCVTRKEDIHVRVESRGAGDFGFAHVSGMGKTEAEYIRDCEDIAKQVRRHVDGLPSYRGRGVRVEWTNALYCEHCGSRWSEGEKSPHNGGCCDKDCEVLYANEPDKAAW